MSAAETDFIYKTLKQIEKLMAINDLTPAEAQVLRENLSGSTGGGVTEDATAALRTLLKRHAGAKKPRRRHNVLGDGPRMGPSGRVGQRRASGGGSSVGGGSSRGGRRSRNGSRESARANDSSLPPIEGEPPAQALDDWSAIALYQDHFYIHKKNSRGVMQPRMMCVSDAWVYNCTWEMRLPAQVKNCRWAVPLEAL